MTIYRGQRFGDEEIVFIRQFIRDRPELSRWKLSRQLCEAWQWKQANGALRDMVCRGLLLTLDLRWRDPVAAGAPQSAESFSGAEAARARNPQQSRGARTTSQHHST